MGHTKKEVEIYIEQKIEEVHPHQNNNINHGGSCGYSPLSSVRCRSLLLFWCGRFCALLHTTRGQHDCCNSAINPRFSGSNKDLDRFSHCFHCSLLHPSVSTESFGTGMAGIIS